MVRGELFFLPALGKDVKPRLCQFHCVRIVMSAINGPIEEPIATMQQLLADDESFSRIARWFFEAH